MNNIINMKKERKKYEKNTNKKLERKNDLPEKNNKIITRENICGFFINKYLYN